MNAVDRRRHWINTAVAIASLEQRQRPIKSKFLKDAYELKVASVANDKMVHNNGHTKTMTQDGDLGGIESGAVNQATCLDGACSGNG